jgi:hypothetical protein
LILLDDVVSFENRNELFYNNSNNNISSFGEFYENTSSQKIELANQLQNYAMNPDIEIEEEIESGIQKLIEYMHSVNYKDNINSLAYSYEIYYTYESFIMQLKQCLLMPPEILLQELSKPIVKQNQRP